MYRRYNVVGKYILLFIYFIVCGNISNSYFVWFKPLICSDINFSLLKSRLNLSVKKLPGSGSDNRSDCLLSVSTSCVNGNSFQ